MSKIILALLLVLLTLGFAPVRGQRDPTKRFIMQPDASKTDWAWFRVMKDTVSGKCFVFTTPASGSVTMAPVAIGPEVPCE